MTEPLSMDQAFIRKLTEIVLANLHDGNFDVEKLSKEAGMSRATLYRKLKGVLNQDITTFIRGIRLKRAFEMLQQSEGTISEIAYKVGFNNPIYFTKCFHDTYGFTPGEIKKRNLYTTVKNQTNLQDNNSGILRSSELKKNPGSLINSLYYRTNAVTLLLILAGLVLIFVIYSLITRGINQNKGIDSSHTDKSIVVLPFKNLSENPENQWFADGITEDILNHLFRINDLRVISRTTSEYLSRKDLTSPEIAKELNVNYVLEGSISREGNRVRIYVQLIDARTDRHLLSERFENEMTNIFEIQSDIAKKVADELETVIIDKEIIQIEKVPTSNSEAYNYYLQARFFLNKRTSEGFTKSIEYFEKAIAADAEYALAWAGLADAYYLMNWWEVLPVMDRDDYLKAKEYALKALDLDRNLGEAHAVLGALHTWYEWDWEEARKEMKLAVELNPSYSFGHSYYFELLNILGENKAAREQINIALELDPFVPVFHSASGWFYYNEGKFQESINEFQKVIELDPSFNPYMGIFNCYVLLNDNAKALDALNRSFKTDTSVVEYTDLLIDIYRRSGINGIWDWLIEKELNKSRPSSWNLIYWFLRIGKKDEALDMLERAFEEKIILLPSINNNFELDIIRSEPRFQTLIKKMGLSDYQKRLSKES